jgi:hypothetical protein
VEIIQIKYSPQCSDNVISYQFQGETKFIEGEWVLEDVLEHATPISATLDFKN